jgi:hypothetical protein
VQARARTLLLPREHGTYGEVVFPLLSALVLGEANRAAWGLTLVALAGFLAHEGFVVLLGSRGARARRDAGPAAWRSVGLFAAVAVAGAALAWPGLTRPAALGLGLAAALSAAAMAVAWLGREQSLAGELLAALALTSWSVPVALVGAVAAGTTLIVWTIWCVVYGVATVIVHAVIAGTIRQGPLTAKRLRTIGWSIVGVSAVTWLLIWIAFR